MKLLVLSYWFPYPPINGAKMRTYNLFKRLAEKHDLHLLSFYQEDEDLQHIDKVREFCSDVQVVKARPFTPSAITAAAGLFSMRPRSSVECFDQEMADLVRRTISKNNFDAALACTLRTAEYLLPFTGLPKVVDEDNAESAYMLRNMNQQTGKLSRFRHKMTWMKARRYERETASKFDVVTAVSEEDAQEISQIVPQMAGRGAIRVVPNGVDPELFNYIAEDKNPYKLVYTGALSYYANLDAVRYFCLEIFPLIKQKIPEAQFVVTGSTKGADISNLAEIDGVKFTGFVPDIRPVVAEAAALVVSARLGGGTRLKVLEAMALGTPVVATTLGGMGFGAVHGRHLLTADEPHDFAEAVISVIQNKELAQKLAANAKDFARQGYGWDTITAKLNEAIALAVKLKGGSRCATAVTIQPTG